MSGPLDTLPFTRGKTLYQGTPTDTSYVAPVCGEEFRVRDIWFGTNRMIVLRAVRNEADFGGAGAGSAVLPKRLARLSADGKAILGYTRLPSERGFPIDHLLPSAGCAYKDVCYVVVEGPAIVITSLSNYSSDIAARDSLNSMTAATSGATTAGRLRVRLIEAATADATAGQRAVTESDGLWGQAVSTALTTATNSDLLVDVQARRNQG
jgi:hypothetical protein